MKYLSTKEFAERIGVHQLTVIRWDNVGTFAPHHKTPVVIDVIQRNK
jgi:hypothetical protein